MPSIGFLVYPGFAVVGVGCLSVFDTANRCYGSDVYDVRLISEHGGEIRCRMGIAMQTEAFGARDFDTVIVAGGNSAVPPTPGAVTYLRGCGATARRISSICTGALYLAEAGLLDGKRATTHWGAAERMQAAYPTIKVNPDCIYIVDGNIWTSAGMTTGFDMALAMVEQDLGHELAVETAKTLVMYNYRSGGQLQYSALLELDAKSDRIQNALAYAKKNLRSQLSVEELAAAANLSPRQFSRVFRSETGKTPAKAMEALRVEAARLLLEQGRHPVDDVAQQCGFTDRERMRKAFLRAFRQPPQAIRRNARSGYPGLPFESTVEETYATLGAGRAERGVEGGGSVDQIPEWAKA